MNTLLLFVSLIALSQAGLIPLSLGKPRIINGEDVKAGEIPYQVSVQTTYNEHICGGSIINANYVITAAHCVEYDRPSDIKIIAASINLDNPVITHLVEKIIVHKGYDAQDSWRHDIALIKIVDKFVTTSVLNFVPLALPTEPIPAESVAVVSGWGSVKEGGSGHSKLQKTEILIADQDYCIDTYKPRGYKIHSTQICAHDPVEMTGSCHGDSGGPLTVNGKLVGLVSWAIGCAGIEYPTVYTRVTEYHDWINENII